MKVALTVIAMLAMIVVMSSIVQGLEQRLGIESFDGNTDATCKIVPQLNCSRKWQCIDGVPMRVKEDGSIEFLNASAWDQRRPNMEANCAALVSTLNMTNLGVKTSTDMNAMYGSHTSMCTQECGDTVSSCYHAMVSMPSLNNCQPSVSPTLSTVA